MITVKAFLLAPIYGFAFVASGIMSYAVGPDLEERLFPVITDQTYAGVTRTSDRVCRDWTYTKQRNVTLERKALYVERPDGIRFPVDELRPDLGIPSNNSTTARAGQRRTIPECVLLPAAVQGVPRFTVRGANMYSPWHRLWVLAQPIMPIDVDMPAQVLPIGQSVRQP